MNRRYPQTPTDLADQDELWAPVASSPGYEASTLGRIRSVDRVVIGGNGARQVRGRVLAPVADRAGYVYIRVAGQRRVGVHALVLEAFIGPRPDGHEGCHEDDNPRNNRLDNLRWDTPEGNTADRVRRGNSNNSPRNHPDCPWGHPLSGRNLANRKTQRSCRACLAAYQMKRRLIAKGQYDGDFQALTDAAYNRLCTATDIR